jgi:hypothetical protein
MRAAAILTCGVLIFLGACGDKGGGGGTTYGVDMDAMKAILDAYAEEQLADQKGDDAELFASIKQGFVEQYMTGLAGIRDMRLVLASDGTMAGYDQPEGAPKMRGTWKVEGTTLTLTTTEDQGQKKDPPLVMTGRLEGGVIRIRLDPQQPFDLALRSR